MITSNDPIVMKFYSSSPGEQMAMYRRAIKRAEAAEARAEALQLELDAANEDAARLALELYCHGEGYNLLALHEARVKATAHD